jgi:benzoate transport
LLIQLLHMSTLLNATREGGIGVDPRETLSVASMSGLQITVVAMTVALTALDGLDVLAISLASPGIAAEWHIDRAALGVVLSAELAGMSLGSIVLGRAADRIGRRPVLLVCLLLMTVGMFMVPLARGTADLSIWRLLTGLGVGGMLATASAVAGEFSSSSRREFSVSLMAIGYPIGAVAGGLIGAGLLRGHDWRSVFYLGGTLTALFIPVIFLLLPESVHWLTAKQPGGALAKINDALTRMGHSAVTSLPAMTGPAVSGGWRRLFSPELRLFTLLATAGYSFHILTFYYILKWVPAIVVDMGFRASSAAGVLVWTNIGGVVGAVSFGLLAKRLGLQRLTMVLMLLSAASVVAFGRSSPNLQQLSMTCAGVGFCITAATVGMYGVFVRGFPTSARSSGAGFGLGFGRGGSLIAPILAGFLFQRGHSLASVSTIMALGSLIGAAAVFTLSLPTKAS